MSKEQFTAWAQNIRDKTYSDILHLAHRNGRLPEAVIAGGEYQYAFMEDYRNIQRTVDGGHLWRGIPLFRCGAVNKVMVVWDMEDIKLPQPPKGERV